MDRQTQILIDLILKDCVEKLDAIGFRISNHCEYISIIENKETQETVGVLSEDGSCVDEWIEKDY